MVSLVSLHDLGLHSPRLPAAAMDGLRLLSNIASLFIVIESIVKVFVAVFHSVQRLAAPI
jgi:hypothetical protein